MGLVGPGFVAAHHIDAVRRLWVMSMSSPLRVQLPNGLAYKAKELNVDRAYGTFQDLIEDPDIQVVHNTTPNHLHFPVSMATLQAGKHVISDKPWP